MRLRSADFRRILRPTTFLNQTALRSGIVFANTELLQGPSSDSPSYFDNENTYQIRTRKQNGSAQCFLPATLLECWPQVCRVKITFESLRTTLFVFRKVQFDEMLCELDSSEYVRPFKSQPCGRTRTFIQTKPNPAVANSWSRKVSFQPNLKNGWPQLCRVLHRSGFATKNVEFS